MADACTTPSTPTPRRRAARIAGRQTVPWPSWRPRCTGRHSPDLGLPREEGRCVLEDVALLLQALDALTQLAQLLALGGGQLDPGAPPGRPAPARPSSAASAATRPATRRRPGSSGPHGPTRPPHAGTAPDTQASSLASVVCAVVSAGNRARASFLLHQADIPVDIPRGAGTNELRGRREDSREPRQSPKSGGQAGGNGRQAGDEAAAAEPGPSSGGSGATRATRGACRRSPPAWTALTSAARSM